MKKQWNQLNIKQYDSKEAFIKISPLKINLEELPKKKFKLITKIKMSNRMRNASTMSKALKLLTIQSETTKPPLKIDQIIDASMHSNTDTYRNTPNHGNVLK